MEPVRSGPSRVTGSSSALRETLMANRKLGYSAGKRWNQGGIMLEYHCTACTLPEHKCQCEKFCILCRSDYNVRLCQDGCYYCRDCREVCEFSVGEMQSDE